MMGVQVLTILFSLFMAYLVHLNYKRKLLSKTSFALWELLWAMLIIIVLFPSILDPVIETFNFSRLFDLMSVAAFAFLALFSFHNFVIASKNKQNIEKLVRKLALDKENQPQENKEEQEEKEQKEKDKEKD
ncbi:MAG: hypothetical protein PWQ87_89 [Candidatus Woesearchaeota archaeon]|nr:hypothetical protein [Candidatus Woesearchaeota archaeon]